MIYSIKDLENLSGIKAHTLRIWESRYSILIPSRTETNIRVYTQEDLKKVLSISLLNEHGYKISRIAAMTEAEVNERVTAITAQHNNYPDQVQALTLSMIQFNEETFNQTITGNINYFGFEKTMLNIIFPLLKRVGYLWLTGTINVAQEHFICLLIRQKIIAAIEALPKTPLPNHDIWMLYLPEGEWHELSLLFSSYAIQARGHKVIYLGQSLPLRDVIEACITFKPKYIVSVFITEPSASQVQTYINTLSKECPTSHIIVSGSQAVARDYEVPANMKIIPTITNLYSEITQIKP